MDLKILILQILNEQDALTIIETQEKISGILRRTASRTGTHHPKPY